MKRILSAAALALAASPVAAHGGHGDPSGLLHGLLHPVLGADHLLAMVAVGLWSGFVLPRRAWAGAAAFLGAMAAGAALSWAGVALPGTEGVILASVVAFGLLVLVSRRGQGAAPTGLSLAAVASFAVAHGHAHAAEAVGQVGAYLAGFLLATGALHLLGIALARVAAGTPGAQRATGAAVALGGLALAAMG